MSRKSPDILPPCGGVPIITSGPCFQHYTSSSEHVPIYQNVTRVVDYHSEDWSPTGIPPYERPWDLRNQYCWPYKAGGNDCLVQQNNGAGATGNPSRDLPTTCSFLGFGTIPPDTIPFTVSESVYHNCFLKTTSSVTMASCRLVGFKTLLATKVWQGREIYTSKDHGQYYDSFDWCCNCYVKNYVDAPSTTKYLKIEGSVNYQYIGHNFWDDEDYTITATANGTHEINRYSGLSTHTETSASSVEGPIPYEFDEEEWANIARGFLTAGNTYAGTYLMNFYCNIISKEMSYFTPTDIDGGGNHWKITWAYGENAGAEAVLEINLSNWTLTYSHETEYWDGEINDYKKFVDRTDSISFGANTMTHNHMDYGECPIHPDAGNGKYIYSLSFTLSNPYTSHDCISDWKNLISNYWNLGDDVQYPWRYVQYRNNRAAPVVGYDEKVGVVALGIHEEETWQTEKVNGSVVGTPSGIPTAPFWNGKHINYVYNQCSDEGEPGWKQSGYGDWGGHSGIPNEATRWTTILELFNDYNGEGIPEGAFLKFSDPYLWGGINAQIYTPSKGYNWIRPCGAIDRFQLDVNFANCINHFPDGNTIVLDEKNTTIKITNLCTCSIWGTDYHDGIWIVNGNANGTCSLQKQIVKGMNLPEYLWGYAKDTTFGRGMICKNRWISHVRPICGRVDIVSINQKTPLTMSLMEPQQGIIDGDELLIKGCIGAEGINDKLWELKPLGYPYTEFAIVGTNSSSLGTPYIKDGYIECFLTPDWKWNSDNPRQNYVIGTYDINLFLRKRGEYQRLQAQSASNCQTLNCAGIDTYCPIGTMIPEPTTPQPSFTQSCIPWNVCSPMVISIMPTPNNHKFAYSQNHHFISNMILDTKYGNWWQSWIIQTMPDPLYPGAPPCPCTKIDDENVYACKDRCKWLEDELCVDKSISPCIDYYAHRDVYEAVCIVPEGAPPLPLGLQLTQSYTVPQIGSVYPILSTLKYQPWMDLLKKEYCICIEGRFAEYYRRNGVICDSREDFPLI